jgi:hypothetical protein
MPRLTQTVLTWYPVPVAVAIAAALTLAAAEPAATQPIEGEPGFGPDRGEVYFTQCLLDWDAGTHMTKQEWSRTCRRLARERGDPASQTTKSPTQ